MAAVLRKLTVLFSAQSRRDLGEIWWWNAEDRDAQHADRYVDFLRSETRLGPAQKKVPMSTW